jgi:hypothetical protein
MKIHSKGKRFTILHFLHWYDREPIAPLSCTIFQFSCYLYIDEIQYKIVQQSLASIYQQLYLIKSRDNERCKKIYFTSDRYAKFYWAITAQKVARELDNGWSVIFQDEQDY